MERRKDPYANTVTISGCFTIFQTVDLSTTFAWASAIIAACIRRSKKNLES